jgi:large subunit ribosomal protein L13
MTTFMAKREEQKPRWFVIDAGGQIVGKIAVRAANVLRGKVKPTFTSHVDTGDFVVVINAEKCVFTGKKETDKHYMTYSQYPGKEKRFSPQQLRARHPEQIIERAVRGMIPKNRLGRQIITKLKIYRGPAHPHAAQKPEPLKLA